MLNVWVWKYFEWMKFVCHLIVEMSDCDDLNNLLDLKVYYEQFLH